MGKDTMTVEQVKRKLKSVRSLKVQLLALSQRIAELEAEIDGVSAVDYGKLKVKSSSGNSVENRLIRRADRLKALQEEYDNIFMELCAVEDELGERMKRLNPTEYEVISARYLYGLYPLSLRRSAERFGYQIETIKKIQQRAFSKMSDG